jgi:uncharacterized membrane protein
MGGIVRVTFFASGQVPVKHRCFSRQGPPQPEPTVIVRIPREADENVVVVPSLTSGYGDAISDDFLFQLVCERDLTIRLSRRPGHFLIQDSPLPLVFPGDHVDDEHCGLINGVFTLSSRRTPFQT